MTENDNSEDCPICKENDIKVWYRGTCGHYICLPCSDELKYKTEENKCPLCRRMNFVTCNLVCTDCNKVTPLYYRKRRCLECSYSLLSAKNGLLKAKLLRCQSLYYRINDVVNPYECYCNKIGSVLHDYKHVI